MRIQKMEEKTKVNPRKTAISFLVLLANVSPLSQLFDSDVAELDTGAVP
jgi:hypothetical protein